jgi:T-complex protein 1 subunit delta
MDKMVREISSKGFPASFLSPSSQIQTSKGEVIVTNDGATILQSIQALHPASKMVSRRTSLDSSIDASGQLVDLSAAQDVEAGDGTTSVVVLAGSLLGAAEKMLQKGIHPTIIAESFLKASVKAVEFLTEISTPIDLNDRTTLIRAASTSLNSKARRVSLLPILI